MPELKNNFLRGRMNKDLDERLIPNGEYRDATNIQVNTSLGSDVGAIESLRGNQRRALNTLDTSGDLWRSQWGFEGDNPKCIGSYADTQNNKIYWFIATETRDKSAILEFDEASGSISPVIVDTRPLNSGAVLKFAFSKKITGINVIEGILYWTDNNSAPRRVNIERFKSASAGTDIDGGPVTRVSVAGSNILSETTHIYEHRVTNTNAVARKFESADITVIKRAPNKALNVVAKASADYPDLTATLGTAINPATTVGNFSNGNFGPLNPSTIVTIDILGIDAVDNFNTAVLNNKQVVLTAEETNADGSLNVYEVVATLDSFVSNRQFKIQIVSGSANMPNASLTWSMVISEGEPIYKDEFARFTYRWKYYDGEYSPYAPFSKVAFVTSSFSYSQTAAYNKGMDNQIRRIELSNFENLLPDVKAVEILYKSSSSNNVYEVKTFERNNFISSISDQYNATPSPQPFIIEKTLLGPVINSNQLIRPYDNVPRKALAQEIVGNRIVYGNYLQNYNVTEQGVENAFIATSISGDPVGNYGEPSVKSDRDYQIGMTWIDGTGRETPVFTSEGSAISVPKINSFTRNALRAKAINASGGGIDAPSWASHYKFYVKDSSSPYHNLAMDRFYFAEDGNIWISFPSSERNKIAEGDYIILKKEHDTSTPVTRNNRFKILSLENEAPDFIKTRRQRVASAICFATDDDASATLPIEGVAGNSSFPHLLYKSFELGKKTVRFRGPVAAESPNFHNAFGDDLEIQFFSDDFSKSSTVYKISSGGPTGESNLTGSATHNVNNPVYQEFSIQLNTGLLAIDDFLSDLGGADGEFQKFHVRIYKDVVKNLPEFDGRFFVKIEQNATSRNNIIAKVSNLTLNRSILGTIDTSVGYDANDTNGSFINRIMNDYNGKTTVGFPAGKNAAEQDVLSYPSNGYNAIHAGFNDKKAINDSNVTQGLGAGVGARDFSIPGEQYGAPGGDNEFSIGFVAGFADDFKGMGNYGIGDDYPNKGGTNGSYTNAELKNNATLTPEQIDLHSLFDQLKSGRTIKFINPSGVASDAFTIINVNEYYYYREAQRNLLFTGNFSSVARKLDIQLDRQVGDIGLVHAIEVFEDKLENVGGVLSTNNPAIFETEPKERADLDIYYEATDALDVNTINTDQELTLFRNCYSFGNGVESDKIRDDFNAPSVGKGVRVSSIIKEPYTEERRSAGLIYSGIINSISGVNETNEFIAGLKITKDLNPVYGGIQKLYARGGGAQGDLLTLMEDKCFRILANKDALFNADGNAQLTASTNVLGQAVPFQGEFGISKNPESFASYNFRSYFADKSRGAILRLSADGLTVISDKGMTDFFNDLMEVDYALTTDSVGGLIGSYDITTDTYNLAFGNESYSFKEQADGWVTRLTYAPESAVSLNNNYYSFHKSDLYSHDSSRRGDFYGKAKGATVDVILNTEPSKIKNFKTVYYEGDTGWLCEVETDQGNGYVKTLTKGKWGDNNDVTLLNPVSSTATNKEGIWYGWIRGNELDPVNNPSVGKEFSVIGLGSVFNEEVNTSGNTGFNKLTYVEPLNVSLSDGDKIYVRVNISGTESRLIGTVEHYTTGQPGVSEDRKSVIIKTTGLAYNAEGSYTYAVKDNELNTSGLIGYYAKLKFSTAQKVDGEKNELFAVGSEIFISS